MNEYCLLCNKNIKTESSLLDMFYCNDVLCANCRSKLIRKRKVFKQSGLIIEGLYPYKDKMQEVLLQYKEMYDEALYPLFLYKDIKYLKRKYKDYVLVPVPSSKYDYQRRGFHHVELMFSLLGLPIVELFEKNKNINLKNANYALRQKIKDVIVLKENVVIPDKKILLIDDVVTTKASLLACYHKLNRKDVKALVICYAYLQTPN